MKRRKQGSVEWVPGIVASLATVFLASAGTLSAQEEAGPSSVRDVRSIPDWKRTDNLELVERIRTKILATQGEMAEREMADYKGRLQASDVDYEMIAIPGGEFLMGSPTDEVGRAADEGPQQRAEVAPFWMGKYEITWEQFFPFVNRWKVFDQKIPGDLPLWDLCAVSGPSESVHAEPGLGMGTESGFPAINMTQHCASKFCQWLSAQTGHYYRLPTEAEWEYACRAGTTTAYYFGDDPAMLGEYDVFDPNGERVGYEKVGTRKPNPWGLFDMHGNVCELCLDQYYADAYAGKRQTIPAKDLYPRVMRGGSWYDEAVELRSAARSFTSENFKARDWRQPRSIWFFSDAPWLGFRIVRPLEIPDAETMYALWNSGGMVENGRQADGKTSAGEK